MAAELLRAGVLDGLRIAVCGATGEPTAAVPSAGDGVYGQAVRETAERLGAAASVLAPRAAGEGAPGEGVVEDGAGEGEGVRGEDRAGAGDRAGARGVLDVLVFDGAAAFAVGGLHGCLAAAWDGTHAAVNEAFLPAGRGGRIVYLAPAPGAGPGADAARAGLENLARTLSVEWARHGVTTVVLALGDTTAPGEVGTLVSYLASPAGAYFSGCQLDLRGILTALRLDVGAQNAGGG